MRVALIKIKGQKGSSAVEFALTIPILFLILFGVIEYGWYLTNLITLENAVSSGARAGVKAREWLDGEEEEGPVVFARDAVKEAFWISSLRNNQIDVTILNDNSEEKKPRRLEVVVKNLEYQQLTGYIPMIPEFLGARSVVAFP